MNNETEGTLCKVQNGNRSLRMEYYFQIFSQAVRAS